MIHKLGKLRRFQAGGGRLLPKLVYGQDAALLNVLGTARATGFEQDLAVENQQMKRDQQRLQKEQAELRNTLARETFDYKKERDLILDDRYNQALKVEAENTLWDRDLHINAELNKYQEKYTGLNINASDQVHVDAIANDLGLLNENGLLDFGKISDQNGLKAAGAKYAKFTNLIKGFVKTGEETSLLGTNMNTLLGEYRKNKTNPANIGLIDTEATDVLAQEMQDIYREINTNPDADPALIQKLSGLVSSFEVEQSKYSQNLQDLKLKDSESKLKLADLKLKEEERAASVKEEKAILWQKFQKGEIDEAQYNEKVGQILLLDAKYQKLMNSTAGAGAKQPTEAVLKQQAIEEIAKINRISMEEARYRYAVAEKGEQANKDESLSNYTNVIVDKDGFTARNGSGVIVDGAGGMKLQDIMAEFKGTDTPGSYETWGWDTATQDLTGDVGDETETNFTPFPNGEWTLTTNNIDLYAKLHGLGDPNSWSKEKWESVKTEDGMFKVEAGDIGRARTIGDTTGPSGTTPNAYTGANKELTGQINEVIFGKGFDFTDPEAEYKYFDEDLGVKFADNMTGGSMKQFNGMLPHAKNAIGVMSPLMKRHDVIFTSGKREMDAGHGGNTGHARGEKADMQIIVQDSHFEKNPEKYLQQVNEQKGYLDSLKNLINSSGGDVRVMDHKSFDDLTYVFTFNQNGRRVSWKARIHKSIGANNKPTGTSHIDWNFGAGGIGIANIVKKQVN